MLSTYIFINVGPFSFKMGIFLLLSLLLFCFCVWLGPHLWAIYKLKSILCTAGIFLTGEQEAAQARCLTPPGGTDQTRSS